MSKADKFTSEYMSSLRHVGFSISVNDSRPGHRSYVERIGGGRDAHLYKASRFGQDRSGIQVSEARSGK